MILYLGGRYDCESWVIMEKVIEQNVKPLFFSYCIVLGASILVVLGDIRSLVSPLGYWCAWIVIAFFGFAFSPSKAIFRIARDQAGYLLFFLLLALAFMLSALANTDVSTFYQGVKVLVIALVFLSVYTHCSKLSVGDYYSLSVVSISVSLMFFSVSKFYFTDLHITLGDGRQGSQFAYPGVLWKTCAFFVLFVIVGVVYDGKSKVVGGGAIAAAFYLLVMDSSRTGFLVFSLGLGLMVILTAYLKPRFFLLALLLAMIASVVLFTLSALGLGFLNIEKNPLVIERLAAGDPVRAQMLVDGVKKFGDCLPFGCGFGTTTSEVQNSPMVVHNAFLSSGGDLGVMGFASLSVLIFLPVLMFLLRCASCFFSRNKSIDKAVFAYAVAAFGGSISFALLLMLHPFSTELSEWGIWILMASALSVLSKRMINNNKVECVQSEA